ncbi:unnamed protein product [Amoebophrya sp. A25]|nr:unnamed protein product [Amoebophrya sp. A25]|eukprot:GSA25T00002132001.1
MTAFDFAAYVASAVTVTVTKPPRICKAGGSGIVLPFSDTEHEDISHGVRAVIYLFVLGWLFMGVAISSDVFMSGIEKITSQKKRVKHPTDSNRMVTVLIWNDTVANLTLMAFGSSTPEILLSIIELVSKDFYTGELGANTIVGSASFNLLLIIGLCISVIGSHEVRMIKDMTVYGITAFFAIFSYLWLYFVLQIVTPNRVDIWEGIVTFFMFPGLVWVCYLADKGYFSKDRDEVVTERVTYTGISEEEIGEYADRIRKKFGKDMPDETVLKLLETELKPKKTRATYRSEAIKGMTSRHKSKEGEVDSNSKANEMPHVYWDVPDNEFVCLECAGTIEIPVRCVSSTKKAALYYETRDGTGKHQTEYIATKGKLEFEPGVGEVTHMVKVDIVDDEIVEDDMDFYIDLFPVDKSCEIFGPTLHVTILDDDFPGFLQFEHEEVHIGHDASEVEVRIQRRRGGSGELTCKIHSEEGKAKDLVDFEPLEEEELTFADGEIEKTVTVSLRPSAARARAGFEFRLLLTDGSFNPDTDGGEDTCICTLTFKAAGEGETDMLKKARTRLISNWDRAVIGSSSYTSQFVSAIYCGGSPEEQAEASALDMVFHVLSVPWNLMCACAPPPTYGNGWATFYGALLIICIQTAIVADVAEMVGCNLDIPDMVTAITLVALGTSLPDTFASRTAALQDEYADSSVTNVTGSNSVNVFVGLGVPWTMGAIYWAVEGKTCEYMQKIAVVKGGLDILKNDAPDGGLIHYGEDLGSSVVVYSCCAIVAIGVLYYRRVKVGGEFGGPASLKWGASLLFVALWATYIVISSIISIQSENDRPAIKIPGGLAALCSSNSQVAAHALTR